MISGIELIIEGYLEDAANDHQFHTFKIIYNGATNEVEFYKMTTSWWLCGKTYRVNKADGTEELFFNQGGDMVYVEGDYVYITISWASHTDMES